METNNDLSMYELIVLITHYISYLQQYGSVATFNFDNIKEGCEYILNYISKLEEKTKNKLN
jgi:hypothetical protein